MSLTVQGACIRLRCVAHRPIQRPKKRSCWPMRPYSISPPLGFRPWFIRRLYIAVHSVATPTSFRTAHAMPVRATPEWAARCMLSPPFGPVPEYAAQAASSAPPHHSTASALDALAQRRYERPEGLDRCALLGADRLGVRLQREDRGAARLAAAAHARTPASAVYSVCAQAPQAQACVLHGTSGRPCAQQAQEGSLPTSKGVTYLEVKWHMLMA